MFSRQPIRRGPPPKPLDRGELARVWTWQRQMIRFHVLAMLYMLGVIVVASRFGGADLAWPLTIVGLPVLLAIGAYVQFRTVCPRCGYRIGRQARMFLPQACKSCGVEFPKLDDPGVPQK